MATFQKANPSTPTMDITKISDCVSELMNAATSFHKLHLKIKIGRAHV